MLRIHVDEQGFNEGRHDPYTSEDIRFVSKGDALFAHVLAWPENNKVLIKSLSLENSLHPQKVTSVALLGSDKPLKYSRTNNGLEIELPDGEEHNNISFVLKIS